MSELLQREIFFLAISECTLQEKQQKHTKALWNCDVQQIFMENKKKIQ